MKKYKYLIICLLLCITIMGCYKNPTKVVSQTPIGKIVSAQVVPTSFNESVKMQITTDQMFVVIYTITSVKIGANAYLVHYSNNRDYITWDGADTDYAIR